MLTAFAMSLPGLVVLLFVVAVVDQLAVRAGRTKWIPWRGGDRTGRVSSTGFAQLHMAFEPSKAHDVNERASQSLLREDDTDGAPLDLDSGTIVVSRRPVERA